MNSQNALKLLFELRAVLDRLDENDTSLEEALAHDVQRALRLTDACIAELTKDELRPVGDTGPEEDEEE